MKEIGFIGLGSMGEPMALNLVRSGKKIVVWNRSKIKSDILKSAGAEVAESVAEVFLKCEIVITMLANAEVIDLVLSRGQKNFAELVRGKILINMGTNPPAYSKSLERDVIDAGGFFVEAPVSGSRKPAESAQLITMVAGDAKIVARVKPLFSAMCRETVDCGAVPSALLMKFAVNTFLIATVTGLAEAHHFALRQGLNIEKFVAILNGSQMASDISRVKNQKILENNFSKQAGISDVLANNTLILEAAREARVDMPLMNSCHVLYQNTEAHGFGNEDMIAVIKGFNGMEVSQ